MRLPSGGLGVRMSPLHEIQQSCPLLDRKGAPRAQVDASAASATEHRRGACGGVGGAAAPHQAPGREHSERQGAQRLGSSAMPGKSLHAPRASEGRAASFRSFPTTHPGGASSGRASLATGFALPFRARRPESSSVATGVYCNPWPETWPGQVSTCQTDGVGRSLPSYPLALVGPCKCLFRLA